MEGRLKGPRGGVPPKRRGSAEESILLHEQHFTALLPLPAETARSPFGTVVRRMSEAGALLPPLAVLPAQLVLERLSDTLEARPFAVKDRL